MVEIRGGLGAGGLDVRVVAGDAAQLLCGWLGEAGAVALAEAHGIVVFEVVVLRGIFAGWENLEYGKCLRQALAGAEILIGLARHQDARVSDLMAPHADIVRKLGSEAGGVDDGGVG